MEKKKNVTNSNGLAKLEKDKTPIHLSALDYLFFFFLGTLNRGSLQEILLVDSTAFMLMIESIKVVILNSLTPTHPPKFRNVINKLTKLLFLLL